MRGTKTFVLLLVLLCGPFISLGKYVEEASEKKSWWDKAEVTDDTRLMEDEGEEEEEEEYGRDEREEEEEYNRDVDREKYEQEERDAGEELVHIPEQSSEEPLQEEASDDDEDNPREFDEEEEEVDNFQDGRMMDQDEGGMSLAGQTEKDVPDQTAFESFKKKVEEINKANKEMQAEINKLKVEFDKALSSDSNNGAPDILVDTQHVTSSSVINAREDTAEDTKNTGVQQRTYDERGLIRQHSEIGEDANLAPDEDY